MRVYGAVGREDHLFAITLEHRLLLPDLQHLELGRNELQLLFDLGKEHLAGADFLLIAEGKFDALAQQ